MAKKNKKGLFGGLIDKLTNLASKSAKNKQNNKKNTSGNAKKNNSGNAKKPSTTGKKPSSSGGSKSGASGNQNKKNTSSGNQKSGASKGKKNTTKQPNSGKKNGGIVLSGNSKDKQQKGDAAEKGKEKLVSLLNINKNNKKKNDWQAAIKEGQNRSALGTKVEKHEKEYDTGMGFERELLKGANIVEGAGRYKETEQAIKDYYTKPKGHHGTAENRYWRSKEGQEVLDDWLSSAEGQKAVNDTIKANVAAANKQLDKTMPSKLKYSYTDMTQQEYNKLATAAQTGQLNTLLKSNKELADKVRDLNVNDYVKSAGAMGWLDQMTQGISVSKNPVYDYSDTQKQIIEKQQDSTAYKVGRLVGAATEFGLAGTGTMGQALAKTGGKVALKNAAKGGAKNLVKANAKNIAKETGADALVSIPLNALDALKDNYIKDNKWDMSGFGRDLAMNVAGDILIGGVVSGFTHGLSASQVSRFNRINETLQSGGKVSDSDMKFYDKHVEELADKVQTAVMREADVETSGASSEELALYGQLQKKQNAGVKLTAEEKNALARIQAKAEAEKKITSGMKADDVAEVKAAEPEAKTAEPDSIFNDIAKLEQEKVRTEVIMDNSRNAEEIAAAEARLTEINAELDSYKAGTDVQAAEPKKTSSMTKEEYNTYVKLKAKEQAGGTLTEAEERILDRIMAKAEADYVKKAEEKAVAEVRKPYTAQVKAATSKENVRLTDADLEDYITSGNEKVLHKKSKISGDMILKNDSEIERYIKKSLTEDTGEIRAYAVAGKRFIDDVLEKTSGDVDLTGKWIELPSQKIKHAKKYHTKAKRDGDLPLRDEDFYNIANYMDNYDDIMEVVKTSQGVRIKVGKRVNGYSVITEMVSDGRNSVKFENMWRVETGKYFAEKEKSLRYQVSPQALPGNSDLSADRLSTNNISNFVENVNPRETDLQDFIKQQTAREAEIQKANGEPFSDTAARAAANPGKQYDTAAERIKGDNLSPDEFFEGAQRISPDEVPQARQTAVKLANQSTDDVADIIEPWIKEGILNKKVLESQEEAIAQAKKELESGRAYQNFMDSNVEKDEHLFMARAQVLLEDLMQKAPDSDEAAEMLLNVMDKATDASSHAGRLLNATKLLLRNTPQGRARVFTKEVERLNKRFGARLKGKRLELSAGQKRRIMEATDDTIEEVAEQINKEIWEDIPATWFEKFNEIRHTSMLFNPKTHIRNVAGNTVFKAARDMSDALEVAAYRIPAVRKRLENLGGKIEMVHVSREEISKHKDVLNVIFDENYGKSGSKNRYIETSRPDGAPIVKNRVANKIIQTNYGLLEKEDMLMFRPEYKKNFVRWCKANGVDLDGIPNMTKEQMQKADAYALKRAEYATFRDNSAFARKIVGLKEKTAGKKGKTVLGTAAYRTANIALESNLPFVKTPVNILRRSVDFSPLGLGRSMAELATAKSADDFMQGVHHMATGLTGSGVFALGVLLANNDLITVKAGEESGDAYYDRDMGYQDYSLLLTFDGKEYSVTIDWLSPMQTSLFMGAAAYNNLSDGGFTARDIFDCLIKSTGPMLDMSFMSSAKDTIVTFQEKVYRNGTGDDANWTDAIMQTLFGSVPQGYLNSFVPQIMSQTAQAFDDKQRDTRSTKEDPIAASWESWGRKMINKVPGLRNKVLNPKLDRFGNDKETGNNIVTRILNAYINPSNVKEITTTELDKEIIKIYNHMEEGKDKKEFYYNFTGNPSYDLGDGKRMSYDEAYEYGKSKRREQTTLIEEMTDAKRYKNMTWGMKADEVDNAHWISQTKADLTTYGAKFAANKIINNKRNGADKEAHTKFMAMGGKNKNFVNFYLEKEKMVAQCHDTSYYTKAIAAVKYGDDQVSKAYGIYGEKLDNAKTYFNRGGSVREYTNSMCNVISTIKTNEASVNMPNKAVAAAYHSINRRTYKAMGLTTDQANMGVGLKQMGYDFDKLSAMEIEALVNFDADGNNSLKKAEIIEYIDSLGLDSNEEKACIFAYFSTAKNPYGSVPNYLNFNDWSASGGYGYGRSYSSKSKSSKSTKSSSADLPPWEEYVKDYMGSIEEMSGVKFKSWDSPLDQAYRNKINTILKNTKA